MLMHIFETGLAIWHQNKGRFGNFCQMPGVPAGLIMPSTNVMTCCVILDVLGRVIVVSVLIYSSDIRSNDANGLI